MRIGIDVSQLAFSNTGVENYLKSLLQELLRIDTKNEYVLFFSSLRGKMPDLDINNSNVSVKKYKIPPTVLDILWNKLHILPIENFIGNVDIFITSDWTEPPTKRAKKATILYDLIIYKYPKETDDKIISTQKKKLEWVKKEVNKILCISEATKKDAMEILGIDEGKLEVISAGI